MKSTDIDYRYETEPGDPDTVRGIVESSGYFYPEEIDVAVELVDERLSKGDASGYHFIFAGMDRRTVGYACFGPIPCTRYSFDLYWIAVDEDFRGKKIGRGLLGKAEAAIRAMNGRRIYVETSSRDLYEPTRIFYARNGYQAEATLKDFYAPGDSKVVFLKEISDQTGAPGEIPL